MMVNEMLRIDHLEKRIAESQAEIIKEIEAKKAKKVTKHKL
jgi:uncharacterized small protein (DUF1192 family)